MALPPLLELIALVARGLQFLFAVIELGITGHIASYGFSPSENSFLVFASVWTFIIVLVLVLIPKFAPTLAHPIGNLVLDAVTMLFWFAGFIALAVFDNKLHNSHYGIFYDANNCDVIGGFCHEVNAAVVFGAFEWILFVATTVLAGLAFMKKRGTTSPATHTPANV